MKASACGIAALLLFAVTGVAEAAPAAKIQTLAPGVLRVGTYFVNPPFEYLSRGRKIGFEVDLTNEIARRLRLRPLFVETQWEVILRQMQEGQYDCIVGGITITPARQQILAWSDPYTTTTLSLIIDAFRSPEIRGLADLKDAVVGVQAATTDYDVAISMQTRREIKDVKVYSFDRLADALTDLTAGRITAVMKVYPVAAWLTRQNLVCVLWPKSRTTRSRSGSASTRIIRACWPQSMPSWQRSSRSEPMGALPKNGVSRSPGNNQYTRSMGGKGCTSFDSGCRCTGRWPRRTSSPSHQVSVCLSQLRSSRCG